MRYTQIAREVGSAAACFFLAAQLTFAAVTNIHTTFGNDARTEVTVSWRGTSGNDVRYGATTAYGLTKTGVHQNGIHHVALTGLTPGAKYYYECGGVAGAKGSFKTAPDDPATFRFAVVGDVQGQDAVSQKWTNQLNWYAAREEAFWVPIGDLVDQGQTQSQWDAFYLGCAALSTSSVIMPLRGNHERLSSKNTGSECNGLFVAQFAFPDNGINAYYSFVYGDALFVVLDPYCGGSGQTSWLEKQLANNARKWIFLFLHPPIYSTGGHGGADLRPAENALFEKYAVNAVFSGHSHSMSVNRPIDNGQIVSSYADGVLYFNCAGTNYNSDRDDQSAAKPYQSYLQPGDYLPVATEVEVRKDAAVVTTYNYSNGSTYHKVSLPPRRATTGHRDIAGGHTGQRKAPYRVFGTPWGAITVDVPRGQRVSVEVVGLNGVAVHRRIAKGARVVYPRGLLRSGIYVVKIAVGSERIERKVVLVAPR